MDYTDISLSAAKRAELLLEKMTVEEKAAQLLQMDAVAFPEEEVLRYAQMGIGSFFNAVGDKVDRIRAASEKTRLKIPPIFAADAVRGHALKNGAVIFPTQLAASCSWNTELLEKMGEITSQEVAEDKINWTFAPILCLARDQRWGRVDETFGEDSYLAGELGAAMVRGYQKSGEVAACAKHYIAYGEAVGGRDACDSPVTERKIREVFLPVFKKAIDAGCKTVMTAYGSMDGTPFTVNKRILRDVLKDELGFDGFVVTDWENIRNLWTRQFVTDDVNDAVKKAVEAGNDMSMNSPEFYDALVYLIKNNKIDIKYVDDALRRVLTVKFELGLFDKKAPSVKKNDVEKRAVNHQLTRESIVLLKNENNILPLGKDIRRIAVIGPNADNIRAQYGDWTYFTHSGIPDIVSENDNYTVLRGMRTVFENAEIIYEKGCGISEYTDEEISRAAAAAKDADVVVLVVGDDVRYNGEYKDRANPELTEGQKILVDKVAEIGTPVVCVLINGKPLCGDFVDSCAAVIEAFNGGELAGLCIAELIAGAYNPSGKLTLSYPYSTGQNPCYYNYYPGWHGGKYMDVPEGMRYPFGYGLSYTTFEYGNLSCEKTENGLKVSVDVTNTGSMGGYETVQFYINDTVSSVMTPVKELKGFKKVYIEKGKTAKVMCEIPYEDMRIVTPECGYVLEKGNFDIMTGPDSERLLKVSVDI